MELLMKGGKAFCDSKRKLDFSDSQKVQEGILPKLAEGEILLCGQDQGFGEKLYLVDGSEGAKQHWQSYMSGMSLKINWYIVKNFMTIEKG